MRKLVLSLGIIATAGLVPNLSAPGLPPWLALLLGNSLIAAFGWIHYTRWQVQESLRRIH